MDISSTSNSSYSRNITPSKGSSDRHSNDEAQIALVENKAQERAQQRQATQEKLQQYKQDNERRLDGRLISFGQQQQDSESSQQQQVSFNRSRVKEAYSPPQNELTNSHKQHSQGTNERKADAIDIVV